MTLETMKRLPGVPVDLVMRKLPLAKNPQRAHRGHVGHEPSGPKGIVPDPAAFGDHVPRRKRPRPPRKIRENPFAHAGVSPAPRLPRKAPRPLQPANGRDLAVAERPLIGTKRRKLGLRSQPPRVKSPVQRKNDPAAELVNIVATKNVARRQPGRTMGIRTLERALTKVRPDRVRPVGNRLLVSSRRTGPARARLPKAGEANNAAGAAVTVAASKEAASRGKAEDGSVAAAVVADHATITRMRKGNARHRVWKRASLRGRSVPEQPKAARTGILKARDFARAAKRKARVVTAEEMGKATRSIRAGVVDGVRGGAAGAETNRREGGKAIVPRTSRVDIAVPGIRRADTNRGAAAVDTSSAVKTAVAAGISRVRNRIAAKSFMKIGLVKKAPPLPWRSRREFLNCTPRATASCGRQRTVTSARKMIRLCRLR